MAQKKHSVEVTNNDLPLEEHLTWHERGWMVQRFGWVFIFLIPLLGAFGLFGDGLLSDKKVSAAGIMVQYEKYARYEKEIELIIESPATHVAQISLPQTYLAHFSEIRLIPEPIHQTMQQGNVVYHFEGNDNRNITLYAMPQKTGTVKGFIQVQNNQISLNHFIYP